MTRALAWAPKCNCRTCRIRRMDSLSVGIPSPPSIATGKRWSQVNTDLLNDLRSRRPSLPPGGGRDQIGRVAAIRSVGWPPSGWNTWPPWIGIHNQAPAEADIQRFFRVSPPSVHQMILKLEQAGLITRQPGVARSITLAGDPKLLPELESGHDQPVRTSAQGY